MDTLAQDVARYPRTTRSPTRGDGETHQKLGELRAAVEYDSETDTYRASCDSTGSMSLAIISTLAAVSGTDPRESEPLYATVDPDALDSLVSTAGDDIRIAFEHAGYHVVVDGTREITVAESDD